MGGRGGGGFGTSGGMDLHEREERAWRRERNERREQQQRGGGHYDGYEGGDDISHREMMERQHQQMMSEYPSQREFRDPRGEGPSWIRGGFRGGYGRRR